MSSCSKKIPIRLRLLLAAALWLSAAPAFGQQYNELPPNSFVGNLTFQSNPGFAVTIPELAASLSPVIFASPPTVRSFFLNIDQITTHGDSIYSIAAKDRVVATSAAFTASRAWTLPAANSVNPGQALLVTDLAGGVTASNTLAITRAGSDTINGGTTATISVAYGAYYLVSDGVSKWTAQSMGAASGGGVSNVTCFGTTITSSGTCVSAAAKSDEQTGTSATQATTPSQQQQHDSAAKAWVSFQGSGTNGAQTINASYNVSSVSRTSSGAYTVTFTTAFASSNYACSNTPMDSLTNGWGTIQNGAQAAGSISAVYLTAATTAFDPSNGYVICFGRQ
jgi:hypothetical protein